MELTPKQECLYCQYRSIIQSDGKISCNKAHKDVIATINAVALNCWNYPTDYVFHFKVTKCPNWKQRRY